MSIHVVCGVNWGDEGKGRMVDYLSHDMDVVVRYQGGNNAGHTVANEHGTFKLHLVPSGIFNPKAINVLGPGMVIDLQALNEEIERLENGGLGPLNLRIADRAQVVFPFHRDEDIWEEERLGKKAYGSTKRGIAPAYGDRYLKKAILVGELLHPEFLKERLRPVVEWKNRIACGVYGKAAAISVEEAFDWAVRHGERLKPMIANTTALLSQAAASGKNIMFEAQLGALRDVYFGIYPYTTSSSALAAYAPVGSGLFGYAPNEVVGVMKAFSTCVGAGPFVTEMEEAIAGPLRESSGEYGTATGRPRRLGHFDALASRFGAEVQGATKLALTKLDSLSGQPSLKICTAYQHAGRTISEFPLNAVLEHATPVYEQLEGWSEEITGCRRFEELPAAAQRYVLRIEELVGRPIHYVSVGPSRDQMVLRSSR
jgi:adenylosuccinate synthase